MYSKRDMVKLLFIWIPKTSGTTLVAELNLAKKISDKKFNSDSSVTFGHADINKIVNDKIISKDFYLNSFKFCIVRNPYDWAVSLFFYQQRIGHIPRTTYFGEFIMFLSKNKDNIPKNGIENIYKKKIGNIVLTNQWNPQISWIPNDINKIFRFENLDELKELENVDPTIKIDYTKKLNETHHDNYKNYYTEETSNVICQLYKKDFESLGYSFNL